MGLENGVKEMTISPALPEKTEQLYGGISATNRRITTRDLIAAKARGDRWPMITTYDALTAQLFDDAGIPVLLVGDSAAMVVQGHDTTLPITLDEMIPMVAAVVRGSSRALVVADMPFGSYQLSPEQALGSAARFVKEAGAHAVKLEGGATISQRPWRLSRSRPWLGCGPHHYRRQSLRSCWRFCHRARSHARRIGYANHRGGQRAHDRHRRGQSHRCPGLGVAGLIRPDSPAASALPLAVRRSALDHDLSGAGMG